MQAYIDGLPIFTLSVYDWSSSQCGIMIGVLGLVAPVVNTVVGAFSARLPDRHITVRLPCRSKLLPSPALLQHHQPCLMGTYSRSEVKLGEIIRLLS